MTHPRKRNTACPAAIQCCRYHTTPHKTTQSKPTTSSVKSNSLDNFRGSQVFQRLLIFGVLITAAVSNTTHSEKWKWLTPLPSLWSLSHLNPLHQLHLFLRYKAPFFGIKFDTLILGVFFILEREELWLGEILKVVLGGPRTEQRGTTTTLLLQQHHPMFMIQRPIGLHGLCLCLWSLILLSSLCPCTSTIVPSTISASKVTVSPGSLAGSPSSL